MSKINDWANNVIDRDCKCVICNSKKNLEAHHVFKVNPEDKIYYDINNGVTLCKECHDKYHESYGLNCNIKNLLELKHKIGDNKTKKLKKENKRLKKVIKNMRKLLEDSK